MLVDLRAVVKGLFFFLLEVEVVIRDESLANTILLLQPGEVQVPEAFDSNWGAGSGASRVHF